MKVQNLSHSQSAMNLLLSFKTCIFISAQQCLRVIIIPVLSVLFFQLWIVEHNPSLDCQTRRVSEVERWIKGCGRRGPAQFQPGLCLPASVLPMMPGAEQFDPRHNGGPSSLNFAGRHAPPQCPNWAAAWFPSSPKTKTHEMTPELILASFTAPFKSLQPSLSRGKHALPQHEGAFPSTLCLLEI